MSVSRLPALRWGIAGYGDVVSRRALPALHALGQQVSGIWGRNQVRAAALAASHGTGPGTDNFESLLEDADAIYIATPVHAHVPLATRALLAGRHVLVEKPLAGGLPHNPRELLEAARKAGTVSGVAYYRRLSPAARFLADVFASVQCQRASLLFRSPFAPGPADPKIWRTNVALAGGGVLADAGCHRIDLLCMLFGRPSRIAGTLSDRFPQGSERRAAVSLKWPGGCHADALFEWSQAPPADWLTFTAERLTVRCPELDAGRLWVSRDGKLTQHHLRPTANPLAASFIDLIECVMTGRPPGCSLEDALLVDEVVRAASAAALPEALKQTSRTRSASASTIPASTTASLGRPPARTPGPPAG